MSIELINDLSFLSPDTNCCQSCCQLTCIPQESNIVSNLKKQRIFPTLVQYDHKFVLKSVKNKN